MLMKDNLIDEDKAKQEEAAQENLIQKIDRLDCTLESISTRFSRMLAEYSSFQVMVQFNSKHWLLAQNHSFQAYSW